jgi:hypothetical protein
VYFQLYAMMFKFINCALNTKKIQTLFSTLVELFVSNSSYAINERQVISQVMK